VVKIIAADDSNVLLNVIFNSVAEGSNPDANAILDDLVSLTDIGHHLVLYSLDVHLEGTKIKLRHGLGQKQLSHVRSSVVILFEKFLEVL
jgi:hypothetical protein